MEIGFVRFIIRSMDLQRLELKLGLILTRIQVLKQLKISQDFLTWSRQVEVLPFVCMHGNRMEVIDDSETEM